MAGIITREAKKEGQRNAKGRTKNQKKGENQSFSW